ncbi:GGDEF domain-containing protein [Lacticaseibacillus jixiensis]|uniref:GGDEF domain-containing protein n=1 Tax=Lacticaseibacillus jixiensis TaxID=3231926 RepID=UPI0036F1D475
MLLTTGLRLMTFLTNLIIMISFIWLYVWIESDAKTPFIRRHPDAIIIGLTCAFLLFFHVDSLLNIANEGHPTGYGWTFLNFQIATILYALLSATNRSMFGTMLGLVSVWFIWMSDLQHIWLGVWAVLLMWLARRFAWQLTHHRWLYYPFCVLFAAPFFAINATKLHGIDVGWPWQIGSFLVLVFTLWMANELFNSRSIRDSRLRKEAAIDPMTKLYNFGQFDKDLLAAFDRYQDHGEVYALYTFDIDHFKNINDQFGHLSGNEVLRRVAEHLGEFADALEYEASVYRTGGEEFSILLFDVVESFDRATQISSALRRDLTQMAFNFDNQPLTITISLGQDRAIAEDKNYLDIYRRADAFLYSSKNNGRDALTIHGQLIK